MISRMVPDKLNFEVLRTIVSWVVVDMMDHFSTLQESA